MIEAKLQGLTSNADYRQTSEKSWVRQAYYYDWSTVDEYTISSFVQINPYTADYSRENVKIVGYR